MPCPSSSLFAIPQQEVFSDNHLPGRGDGPGAASSVLQEARQLLAEILGLGNDRLDQGALTIPSATSRRGWHGWFLGPSLVRLLSTSEAMIRVVMIDTMTDWPWIVFP